MRGTNKQTLLQTSLQEFYQTNNPSFVQLCDIITGNGEISLRLLDWFVTNYSKKNRVAYVAPASEDSPTQIYVYACYRLQLKAYSKKYFDPFCRRDRINFVCNGVTLNTTIGQLNFFRWALQNEVVDYCVSHKDQIEVDMFDTVNQSHESKRSELSSDSTTKGLNVMKTEITISFN